MKILQFIFFLLFSNFLFGQTPMINKGYAFYKSYLPGMLQIDENGKPAIPCVTLERFIYLENKIGSKIKVFNINYNHTALKLIDLKLAENKIVVGVNSNSGLPITIHAKRGYTFWRLALESECRDEKTFGKYLKEIIISTFSGSKKNNYFLKVETELVAPEMQ